MRQFKEFLGLTSQTEVKDYHISAATPVNPRTMANPPLIMKTHSKVGISPRLKKEVPLIIISVPVPPGEEL
jgi:hypothetical protein